MTPSGPQSAGDGSALARLFASSDESTVLGALRSQHETSRPDSNGQTALHLAAERGMTAVVAHLLQSGVNVEVRDFHDRTPLMLAASAGADAVVDQLLAAGAQAGFQNAWGRTALMYAAHGLHAGAIEKLLAAGASPLPVDRSGYSAAGYVGLREAGSTRTRCAKLLRQATPSSPAADRNRSPKHRLRGWAGCAVIAVLFVAATNGGGAFLAPAIECLVVIGILRSSVIPAVREPSEVPPPPEPAARFEPTAPDVIAAEGSPLFVSSLLLLGSRALAGLHRSVARESPPGFEERMRGIRLASGVMGGAAILVSLVVFAGVGASHRLMQGVGVVAIGALSYGLERYNTSRRRRLIQTREDSLAARIAERLRRAMPTHDDSTDFGLYLRAFHTTNRLKVGGVDLETQIAYSINERLPIVAMGRPGEHIGAGRIEVSDAHWEGEVLRLMERARLILLVPSDHAGTMWEIRALREMRFLDRTVFIMPPELPLPDGAFSAEWNRAVNALRSDGFDLPRHFPLGLFFSVDEHGRMRDHAPFAMDEFFREVAREQTSNGEDSPDPLDAAHEALLGLDDASLGDDGQNGEGHHDHQGGDHGGHHGGDHGGDHGGGDGGD